MQVIFLRLKRLYLKISKGMNLLFMLNKNEDKSSKYFLSTYFQSLNNSQTFHKTYYLFVFKKDMNFVSMDVMTSMSEKLAHYTKSGRWMKINNTGKSMKHKDSGFAQTVMLLHLEYLAATESLVLNVKKVIATNAIFSQKLLLKSTRISTLYMGDIIIEILK